MNNMSLNKAIEQYINNLVAIENRQCGNCQHSYSLWDSKLQKLATRCVGCSKEMPDGGLIMINKIVNWTDKPCENYKPWGVLTENENESESDN